MKSIYINTIIIALFLSLSCKAQEIIIPLEPAQASAQAVLDNPPEAILYFKDVNNTLDKFVGTWLYDDGTHFVQIEITKFEHNPIGVEGWYNDNDFEDRLLLQMEYRLNGIEQYNYDSPTRISGNTINNSNAVELIYSEPSLTSCYRRKIGRLTLEHTGNDLNEQLIWTRINTVVEGYGTCPDGTELDNSDFIVPSSMTLTKQ